ncbi:MAG TPA: transaldolase [Bacteroidota bacterium]|nr:transaldolase [Bacteroidota bacterium]
MNPLQRLESLGQSIWYDNISRTVLRTGELQQMVTQGLLGVTSNPTIFEKAIAGSDAYDAQIRSLVRATPSLTTGAVLQTLMVEDIRTAADVLLPVYQRTAKRDGYVSIEVTPAKARDTAATIQEAQELWDRVGRPNTMIKIPATREGLPAITQSISNGINVNVTLIFSVQRYEEVADAYLSGLEQRIRSGKPVTGVASVASVFVSRIDTMVDAQLEAKARTAQPEEAARLRALAGKAAVANTKIIYQAFKRIFSSPRFVALQKAGAAAQRPLWGSTGTKNPAYSDLLYVDTVIGPHTVNTVPPATYAAILDHGQPALTVESNLDGAQEALAALERAGIDLTRVLDTLERDGVAAFEKSFDGLLKNLDTKRTTL